GHQAVRAGTRLLAAVSRPGRPCAGPVGHAHRRRGGGGGARGSRAAPGRGRGSGSALRLRPWRPGWHADRHAGPGAAVTELSGTRAPQSSPAQTYYAEDHCALNWRFVAAGLCGPIVAAVAFVAAVALHSGVSWALLAVMLLALLPWFPFGQVLPYAWPVSMRLASNGLRIGGVRWGEL